MAKKVYTSEQAVAMKASVKIRLKIGILRLKDFAMWIKAVRFVTMPILFKVNNRALNTFDHILTKANELR